MAKHGKRYRSGRRADRSREALPAGRGVRALLDAGGDGQVRRDGRGRGPARRRSAPGRSERARHGGAAARHRQDRRACSCSPRATRRKEAEEAGADFVGADDLVKKIQDEQWLEFDTAIATPDMMGQVGRLGKVLGPRGLMPNPKVGTVTFDVAKAVREVKAGKVEFRVEKAGIVHVADRQAELRRREAPRQRARARSRAWCAPSRRRPRASTCRASRSRRRWGRRCGSTRCAARARRGGVTRRSDETGRERSRASRSCRSDFAPRQRRRCWRSTAGSRRPDEPAAPRGAGGRTAAVGWPRTGSRKRADRRVARTRSWRRCCAGRLALVIGFDGSGRDREGRGRSSPSEHAEARDQGRRPRRPGAAAPTR